LRWCKKRFFVEKEKERNGRKMKVILKGKGEGMKDEKIGNGDE
jgi:hypothetical protein